MTGIFAIYKKNDMNEEEQEKVLGSVSLLKHRGSGNTFKYENFPIEMYIHQNEKKDMDRSNSFVLNIEGSILAIDGQIYKANTKENKQVDFFNNREALNWVLKNYKNKGIDILNELIGSYSGILYDGVDLIGFKDPVGAKPLYYCSNKECFIISSEFKALEPFELDILPVWPGTAIFSFKKTKQYYNYPEFSNYKELPSELIENLINQLNKLVKTSIRDNIQKGENISGLLSGGIDSTIITHVAKDYIEDLHVYTVGMKESKDITYAVKFAELNNLPHTILTINLKEMLECLPDVIFALETFDAALIRSSVPMFLISKEIKSKENPSVLLTGEGGDELFGGYSYLEELQSKNALNNELLNLLEVEHLTGLQRVDRIPYYFSIEARAPLFDRRLVEFSMRIPPELKILEKEGIGFIKKWILRKAFEREIPSEFIWRKKQKFSAGAGSQYILRNHINNLITDEEFEEEKKISKVFTLRSKEELFYWRIFDSHFNPTARTLSNIGITQTYEV